MYYIQLINWTVVKDVVVTISAATGAIVAVNGLTAWKKQLKGKTDYELARRYLRAVYKTRDAIRYTRNPFISGGEMLAALKEEGKNESLISDNKETNQAVYNARWKKVVEANSDLGVELIEAEVSWGKNAIDIQKDFQECLRDLFLNLKRLLREGEVDESISNIIYEGGVGDEFNKKINAAVEKIENYLRPHLG